MRKLDIMHYLFNKFHSSDVFVIISCEYFQTLRTSEQYPRPMQQILSWQVCIFIGMVSLHISQLFLQKNQSQPDSSYKIRQLKFCKFQIVMFSEKNTFATTIVNIFCKSSLTNHKCWICLLIFTFMSTSEASYSVRSVLLALEILIFFV